MMPFASAYFQPREAGDRPAVVPKCSANFAFMGNFAETPRDTVFTTEYSIRTAMEAVYTLMNVDRGIPEVWGSVYDVRDLLDSTVALRDGRPLTDMKLGFMQKMALGKVMKAIEGTEVEKLLKEHKVI
jgi:oleate hydratase